MSYHIAFTPEAEDELAALYGYIAAEASPGITDAGASGAFEWFWNACASRIPPAGLFIWKWFRYGGSLRGFREFAQWAILCRRREGESYIAIGKSYVWISADSRR